MGLGWLPIVFSRRDNSDVLLINWNKLSLSPFQLAYLKYAARYVDGLPFGWFEGSCFPKAKPITRFETTEGPVRTKSDADRGSANSLDS